MANILSFIISVLILFCFSLIGSVIIRFFMVLPKAFQQAHVQMDKYHKWYNHVFNCFKSCYDDLIKLQDEWNAIIKSRGITNTDGIVLQSSFKCVNGILLDCYKKLEKTRNTKAIIAITKASDLNEVTHQYFDCEIESIMFMLNMLKWGLTEVNEKHITGIIYGEEKRNSIHNELMTIIDKTSKEKPKKEDKVA